MMDLHIACQRLDCAEYATDGSYCSRHTPNFVEEARRTVESDGSGEDLSGWVYFIRSGESTFVKIGFTEDDPYMRMTQLQTGNPKPLQILGFVRGSFCVEAAMHRIVAARYGETVSGEWFQGAELIREILASNHAPGRRLLPRSGPNSWLMRALNDPNLAFIPAMSDYHDSSYEIQGPRGH